jgi:hypothetical protein
MPREQCSQVRRWLRNDKGVRMAHVISIINLEGGALS